MRMREILFRGKRVLDGKWTYGYFFRIWDRAFILWGTTNDNPNMELVHPETVGEYTGLKDKNGKEIYEGDVLKWVMKNHHTGAVCFDVYSDGEMYGTLDHLGWILIDGLISKTLVDVHESSEVIGNIHENSELIK